MWPRGFSGARDRDEATSRARAALDWDKQIELAMDPGARHRREQSRPANGDVCTMCGDLCAYKTYRESREGEQ